MSLALTSSRSRKASLIVAGTLRFLATCMHAVSRASAARRTRRVVAELSEAQLRDAGIDRAALFGSRPTVEVPARLISSLMLMR